VDQRIVKQAMAPSAPDINLADGAPPDAQAKKAEQAAQ
jgi:hypothetical protein